MLAKNFCKGASNTIQSASAAGTPCLLAENNPELTGPIAYPPSDYPGTQSIDQWMLPQASSFIAGLQKCPQTIDLVCSNLLQITDRVGASAIRAQTGL